MHEIETYAGISLLLRSDDEVQCERSGLDCVHGVLRLIGLEHLFRSAQKKDLHWVGLNVLRQSIPKFYSAYRASGRSEAEEKGDCLVARAKKLFSSPSGSGIMNQWEEALDCFVSAAQSYMRAGKNMTAGEAYCEASTCAAKLNCDMETARNFVKAAECYKPVSPLDAAACLQKVIEVHAKHGSAAKVAKYEREVAEIHEAQWEKSGAPVDIENALYHYIEAERHYEAKGEQYLTECNVCLRKVACFWSLLGEPTKAIDSFEKLNKTMTGPDALFRAMLCFLVNVTVDNRLPGIERAQAAFDHYSETDTEFLQSGKEYELVRNVLDAIKRQDMNKFEKSVAAYYTCREQEQWRDYMLDKIEKNLVAVLDSVENLTVRLS
ncbi:Alpha-soluble NSF attachment protein [Diplonema papillatum]|nr:Alpha-soluble NSF attachment protein [Diplonema papillatum]